MKSTSTQHNISALKSSVSAIAILGLVGTTDVSAQTGEIVVTARKREESLQDVPISIQAFTTEQIRRRNIVNFEDYANFLPSVSFGTTAPGATTIVFRGAVAQPTGFGTRSSATLYLDEQPVTADGQNPDIRAIDIQRIEALNGPQPTTFGAGSQSGTLRIITNKPNTEELDAFIDVTGNKVSDGGWGHDVSGMVNIPVIEDKFAIRVVGFYGEEAGFIDNVLGTTTGNSSNSATVSNAGLVEENYNTTDYVGARIQAKLNVNENWSVLASFNYQNVEANGLNNFVPTVGDLDVVRFADEKRDDDWFQAALTIEGDLGFAKLTSATSFFDRDIAYDFDNTTYIARFQEENQYLATYYYGVTINPAFCAAPYYYGGYAFLCSYDTATTRGQMVNRQKDRNITHETRLTYDDPDSRFNWLVGAFYNRNRSKFDFLLNQFDRPSSPSVQAMHSTYFGFPPPGESAFISTQNTLTNEVAVFGEVTVNVTDQLSVTGGARWLHYRVKEFYDQFYLEFYNFNQLDATISDSEVVTMANVKYEFNDNAHVYFTRSVGIRNGGVEALPPRSTLGMGLNQFESDRLVNYEAGIKSSLWDGRVRANLTGFYQKWKNFQLELEDATTTAFGIVTQNIAGATIKGIEAEFQATPIEGLELGTSFTYINAESDVTVPFGDTGLIAISEGERLPTVPNFKLNASIQYTHALDFLNEAEGYMRFDFTHVGDSTNGIPGSVFLFGGTPLGMPMVQQDYQIGNLSAGINLNRFEVTFAVSNLWDERAALFIHPRFNDNRVVTNQPRTFSLGFRARL